MTAQNNRKIIDIRYFAAVETRAL